MIEFMLPKNGVTSFTNTEPVIIEFSIEIKPTPKLRINDPNSLRSKNKIPTTRQKLEELVRECIDVKKMSFVDTVLYLGVSSSTIRRICRTLKIGRYSNPWYLGPRLNSSQVPFGWNSVHGFLEKNIEEWGIVEKMFFLRVEGKSLNWIAAEMTRLEIKTKNGGKWYAKTISQILKFNEKFYGKKVRRTHE